MSTLWRPSPVVMVLAVIAATVAVCSAPAVSGQEQSTYDVVSSGMECRQNSVADFECEYRVGESLHFIIAGIGEPDAGIEILESSSRGDYYAKFGLLHQCVIVSPGAQGPSPPDLVFVSPRTGKIHRDWVTCSDDK